MRNLFIAALALTISGCAAGGHSTNQKIVCSESTADDLTAPPDKIKDIAPWMKDIKKEGDRAPGVIWNCWFPPRWPTATAEPSTAPVIVDYEELPDDAKEAPWVEMPGYVVFYTVEDDGSGYDYWAVENPPREIAQ